MNGVVVRALLRVARRNIAQSPWRSLLVIVLVLLPVSAMVAAATVMKTVTPTPERVAASRMGSADLLVYLGPGGTEDLLRTRLPHGSAIEPVLQTSDRLVVPGLRVPLTVEAYDPGGLAQGMLSLVSGRFATAPNEVAITREVARYSGADIGGRIDLETFGTLAIVGVIENELQLNARTVLLGPAVARSGDVANEATWLVKLPPGTDPQALGLEAPAASSGETGSGEGNAPAFVVQAREGLIRDSGDAGPATIVLGGLALVDAALVAAAAFAVGIRRRQRELGLMSATGAEPRQLLGTVLFEALLLGGLGATTGMVIGLIAAVVASPFLDNLTGHRNPPVALDVPLALIAGAMGTIAAVIAAAAPAWTASRLPVLTALSGRRPGGASARRTLAAGLGVIGLAVAVTAIGTGLRFVGGTGAMSVPLLLIGAVLGTLGFGACSPWLLELLERPAERFPLAARIALRDTARARSRNGPIVTALLAAFAATVALAALQSSVTASSAATFRPTLLPDQLLVQGPGAALGGPAMALALSAAAGAPIPGAGSDEKYVWLSPSGSDDPNAAQSVQNVTTGDAELLRALGADAAIADFETGAVVLLSDRPGDIHEVTLHVVTMDGEELVHVVVPARLVVTAAPGDLPGAVISAAVAARFDIPTGKNDGRYLIRLSHPVTDTDMVAAGSIAAAYPDTFVDGPRAPDVSGAGFRIVLILASLVFALTVTAVAVSLGEAESRPDQRTLLAIGADPALRRRITAARAGVIALLGGLLAVPAGLLPVWGVLASRGAPLVVPIPEVAGAVALLPILAVLGTWLLSRPIPAWSALRDLPA